MFLVTKQISINILVIGGVGFIDSHILIELSAGGHTAVVVDNLSNSNLVDLQRVAEIPFYEVDIRDRKGL